MDSLNTEWLKNRPNFYFRYKKGLFDSLKEGSRLDVDSVKLFRAGSGRTAEHAPNLPFPDNSFDTVICSDTLEFLVPHKQALAELLRVAKKKIIITAPACKWLYGNYDRLLGHKRRYDANDFTGFDITYLFWFLIPVLLVRKIFNLRHYSLPKALDDLFYGLSRLRPGFGTTIMAVKHKILPEVKAGRKISVFIPVFNEERVIERYVKTLDGIMRKFYGDFEIFVINDSSDDKTGAIAGTLARGNKRVSLINYETGRPTRRENLARSFGKAKGDIIVFIDVDLVTSLKFLPDLIDNVMAGYDIVTGSRYVKGAKVKRKFYRLVLSFIYNKTVRFIFRTGLGDHMCGMKAFKRNVILSLVEEMGYDRSLERGIFWDTELLVRAIKHGYRIKEIPVWWKERDKSALYFKREIKTVGYIFKFMGRSNKNAVSGNF